VSTYSAYESARKNFVATSVDAPGPPSPEYSAWLERYVGWSMAPIPSRPRRVDVATLSLADLKWLLREDGYEAIVDRAADIQNAARRGCLLWTARRLTTTDASRIDERSEVQS